MEIITKLDKNIISQIKKELEGKKVIFIKKKEKMATAIAASILLGDLKNYPEFKKYQVKDLLEIISSPKKFDVTEPVFILINEVTDIEELLSKSNLSKERLINFLENSAIVSLYFRKERKDIEFDERERLTYENADANFTLKVFGSPIEIYILKDLSKLQVLIFNKPSIKKTKKEINYAQFFIDDLKRKLGQDKKTQQKNKKQKQEKSLDITNTKDAKEKINDVQIVGDPDQWQLITKAWSESQGWMKSTKALDTGNGCIIQVTTQQKNPDGSYVIAESVTFVPDVKVVEDEKGNKTIKHIQRSSKRRK